MERFQLCPELETAFEVLGKRWTGLIIYVLLDGPKRFSEISERIPNMTDRMMTMRFKELESASILTRRVYPETPVRVEYELTAKGLALEPVMQSVLGWASAWINRQDASVTCGTK